MPGAPGLEGNDGGPQQALHARHQEAGALGHAGQRDGALLAVQPAGHLGQAAGNGQPRAVRHRSPVVTEVFGYLLHVAAREAVEGLEEEELLERRPEEEPERVLALEVSELMGQDAALLGSVELAQCGRGETNLRPAQGHWTLQPFGGGDEDGAFAAGLSTQAVQLAAHRGVEDGTPKAQAVEDAGPGHGQPKQQHRGGRHPGHEEEGAHAHGGYGWHSHRGGLRGSTCRRGDVRLLSVRGRVGGGEGDGRAVLGARHHRLRAFLKGVPFRGRVVRLGARTLEEGSDEDFRLGNLQGEAPGGQAHAHLEAGGEEAAHKGALPGQVPKPQRAHRAEALQHPGRGNEDGGVDGVGEKPGGSYRAQRLG